MRPFETVVVVDWSAANAPTPRRPSADAIWTGVARAGGVEVAYHRTRSAAMTALETLLGVEARAGRRVLLGFDFPFGWPRGFAERVAGDASAIAVWDALAERVRDGDDNASNRWDVAAGLNALFPGQGPFWGCPDSQAREGLRPNQRDGWGGHGLPPRRAVEERVPRAQPGWKLYTTGSVGSQALLGQARLAGLRRRVRCAVWPFEPWDEAPVVLAEVYPSLVGAAVTERMSPDADPSRDGEERSIKDAVQVEVLSEALAHLGARGRLDELLRAPPETARGEEGWILGVGGEAALREAAVRSPGPHDDVVPARRPVAATHQGSETSLREPPPRAGGTGGPPTSTAPLDSGRSPIATPGVPPRPPAGPSPVTPTDERATAPISAARLVHDPERPLAPLRDDCFALPPGVDWTPVDEALARLRGGLGSVTGVEAVPLARAFGRVLAEDAVARRSSPPGANAAVDGWGFRHAALPPGEPVLPVAPGRAAAGAPLGRPVPEGRAVRILTGALLPEGVDTVVLQEDAKETAEGVSLAGAPKRGSNTRRAGEDVAAGAVALPAGRTLTAPDLALLASVGIPAAAVRERLRVGVLSTGDEIAEPGETLDPARTFDANRPMLRAVLGRWGHEAVDLGRVPDDRAALRDRLDRAGVHAVLTSGGASAGEEDHVSALLAAEGRVETWRIAIKPGRPLALGLWGGVPVFGLPGNPVAALVCTLVFARPALSVLSGAGWVEPVGFDVPAAFEKRKKAGRREFLRARLRGGRAEVFASEGSGRVSGLSWAEGLVELGDGARDVAPGDPVRFLPYGAFGL